LRLYDIINCKNRINVNQCANFHYKAIWIIQIGLVHLHAVSHEKEIVKKSILFTVIICCSLVSTVQTQIKLQKDFLKSVTYRPSVGFYENSNFEFTSHQDEPSDYEFYDMRYKEAKRLQTIGLVGTSLGAACYVAAVILNASNYGTVDIVQVGLLSGGFLLFNVGLPIFISSSVKVNKSKKARDRFQPGKIEVSTTGLGVRLVFKF